MEIHVALGQIAPGSRSPEENLALALKDIEKAAKKGAHLIVFPELFPFGIIEAKRKAKEAANLSKTFLEILKDAATGKKINIFAGLPFLKDASLLFNSLFCFTSKGKTYRYDKLNLFPPFNEENIFDTGRVPVDVWLETGTCEIGIGPQICFDIRFPELSRTYSKRGCHLLVVSALWPLSRKDNFVTLLKARAMESQCFVAASNACGGCGEQELAGSSLVVAPDGTVLIQAKGEEGLLLAKINVDRQKSIRTFFNSSWPQGLWNIALEEKILDTKRLRRTLFRIKKSGQKIVFTNGCFDILHAGHVSYLKRARGLGDVLVVGLNSDSSVKKIKGKSRPVNPQEQRARVLAALSFVDFVVIFQEDTPQRLIHELRPDILVKGADWDEDEIVGARFVKSLGGRVERIAFEVNTSTSRIIQRIKASKAPE